LLNFKIHTKLKGNAIYRISERDRSAYQFFKNEYHNLPEFNGTIIVPAREIDERKIEENKGIKSLFVPIGSKLYSYFKTEYSNTYFNEYGDGYYIPEESSGKRK